MIPTVSYHLTYLTVEPSRDPKKIKYHLSIHLKDSSGKTHYFEGTRKYAFDESGQAYADLEVLRKLDTQV